MCRLDTYPTTTPVINQLISLFATVHPNETQPSLLIFSLIKGLPTNIQKKSTAKKNVDD